jgi:hypothetical protein
LVPVGVSSVIKILENKDLFKIGAANMKVVFLKMDFSFKAQKILV